jgi:predicted transcriptional regulator|tara:strand:+ start:488 stop:754 length:267 start_codon:yes stop_codon:yes gene_type:complete
MVTTIQIDEDLKKRLDLLKIHRRETYNEILFRLLENCSLGDVDKESLIETVEVLSDPETMRNIAGALESINNSSKWVSLENVEKERGF